MENKAPQLRDVVEIFSNMPASQLVFLSLFATTWLIGGNILIAYHYKRIGKRWYSGFKPFAFPFRNFNSKEWLIFAILAIISIGFGFLALSYSNG